MRQGFALLDLLVSITISSIMSTIIFTMIFQIQKSENYISQTVSTAMQMALIAERLQQDLTGMCWPKFLPEAKQEVTGQSRQNIGPDAAGAPVQMVKLDKKDQDLSPKLHIDKILYSQNMQIDGLEILQECSFLTSNQLQVYNQSKPRLARIIYKLLPDDQPNSFSLHRQESSDLTYQTAQAESLAFVMANGLRTLKFTYFYESQPSQDEKQTQDDQVPQVLTELDFSENLQMSDNKLIGQVPTHIKVNLELWVDFDHTDFNSFEFWFKTYA